MRDSISSLDKAISILKSYNPLVLELGVTDISKKLAIPTSTAHRLLTTLAKSGLLNRNPNTGKFVIGHTFYSLGSLYLTSTNIIKSAEPVVKTLNELTGEAVNVGILEQGNIVFLMKEETKGKLISLGKILFHGGIPIVIVVYILEIWSSGLSSDAEMEWNIFVTVSCMGSACLVMLVALFMQFIDWKYKEP